MSCRKSFKFSNGCFRIFAIDALSASVVATFTIEGAINCDWEDLAVGPGPFGDHFIYIGDVGGSYHHESCRKIYRVQEPEVLVSGSLPVHGELTYQWNETNCETMMVDEKGTLLLVSKVATGAKVYAIEDFNSRFQTVTLDRSKK